jgi:hypothetical protein
VTGLRHYALYVPGSTPVVSQVNGALLNGFFASSFFPRDSFLRFLAGFFFRILLLSMIPRHAFRGR